MFYLLAMQTIQAEPDAAESAEKSAARQPVSWEILFRLNPVHGRAVSAVTVSVFGVVLLAILCLRVTNWNSTQATRLFIAMPLSTVFRTMALVALPAVFVALFLLVPWLFGSFVAARYFARRRRIEMEQRWIKLRKYHIGVPLMLLVAVAVLLAGFAIGQDWPADRLIGYAAAMIVSFSGGFGIEYAVNDLPVDWDFKKLWGAVARTWGTGSGALFGILVLLSGVLFMFKPVFADPPGWVAWECMKIAIPPEQKGLYRYPDLRKRQGSEDHQVYVVGEHHGRLVILDESTRYVYLIDKKWIKGDRFCKTEH